MFRIGTTKKMVNIALVQFSSWHKGIEIETTDNIASEERLVDSPFPAEALQTKLPVV